MRTIVLTLLLGAALFVPAEAKEDDRLATIHLPEGFVIEPFAKVPNARQMAWGEKGTLFVGTRREGRVFAVTDEDGDGRGERVREVASGLRMPSGVAFRRWCALRGSRQHNPPLRRDRVATGRPSSSR